ncbi:MAG: hypothetical protein COB93_05705 [Sneathiella sp.]|nr:MAG: hypothetical protein COB93_05705 [Sneathiella sp.]
MIIKTLKLLFALLVILSVASVLLLFTPLGDRPLTQIFPVGEVKPIDFKNLSLKDSPNQYLVCPADYCAAPANAVSPIFNIAAGTLQKRWQKMLDHEANISRQTAINTATQETVIQRTAWVRYPDIITVEFIPLGQDRSSLAIYSRSIYGRSDFGENQKRVENWIQNFEAK